MVALIVFRGLQGLGAGSIMATVNTLAGDLYSVRERARIQGWLSSVWGVAAVIGPTLGGAFAAMFGAIFNSAMMDELTHAPDPLRPSLPHRIDAVIGALHGGHLRGAADDYLRHAMYIATSHLYVGMVIASLCTLAVVWLTPRHFPQVVETPVA